MKKFAALSIALSATAFIVAPALSVAADSDNGDTIVVSDYAHAQARIVDINKKTRELTLRKQDGNEIVIVAGKEVRNFDQIQKGDIVEVQYERAAASQLKKTSDDDVASDASAAQRAPAGAKPGMTAMRTSTIVAEVRDVDTKKRLLTVQGPRGGIVTLKVPADMKAFDSLKKGDKISAEYTEAVAISVRTPEKNN